MFSLPKFPVNILYDSVSDQMHIVTCKAAQSFGKQLSIFQKLKKKKKDSILLPIYIILSNL